ncbi:X-linked retinitis pigmentosa GTPase regulator-like [Chrysoperla carnea]|uniref:X-linked retinitis pigmentosa GTPase regulator-like n=1 Tax=Chrysoperla carnea TaxID=189513 RepID=UPI001D095F73|nr:X-linked retinitis pigmentosa GTPase regulator-like [Chrysoperla carnea]
MTHQEAPWHLSTMASILRGTDSGAVYTFGKTRFADNKPSQFFIKNDPIIDIACGDEFTIVLCQNGRLFSFGSNEYGQLGLGHKKTVNRPSCIKTLKPFKVKLIACGRSHSIAVNEYNHIYTFGNNSDGQLGQSNTIDKDIPTKIEDSPTKSNGKIIQVSAGSNHSAVLTEKGRLYIWGSNTEGQLGLSIDTKVEKITAPTMVAVPEKIIHISCGYYHSGFVTENGNAYTFGENENGKLACGLNENGQLGIGDENIKVVSEPVIINKNIFENSDIMNVSCGERHTAFVTKTGKLFTCGDSKYGKLCNLSETNDSEFSPKLVSQFENVKVCGVSCGGCHTIVSIQKNNFQLKLDNIPSKLPALPPMSKKIEIPNIEDNFTNGGEEWFIER